MDQPTSRTQDAVAQARTALRRMELAIRRARFDRRDEPTQAHRGASRKAPPQLKLRQRD
jgi:hypothetical protein